MNVYERKFDLTTDELLILVATAHLAMSDSSNFVGPAKNHNKKKWLHTITLSKKLIDDVLVVIRQYEGQQGVTSKLFNKIRMGKEMLDEDVAHKNRITEITQKYKNKIINASISS